MANPLLGSVLGAVLGQAIRRRGHGAGVSGGMGGAALGGVLAGMLGRGRGGRGALMALLLPYAMRWVQQQGGIAAVLKRFQQRGYRQQAASWVERGDNEAIDAQAVDAVVGRDELDRIAQQIGVPEQEVAEAFSEILPEVVNQLSPEGIVPPDADDALEEGRGEIERELREASAATQALRQ